VAFAVSRDSCMASSAEDASFGICAELRMSKAVVVAGVEFLVEDVLLVGFEGARSCTGFRPSGASLCASSWLRVESTRDS
jgi:hypothetical protein